MARYFALLLLFALISIRAFGAPMTNDDGGDAEEDDDMSAGDELYEEETKAGTPMPMPTLVGQGSDNGTKMTSNDNDLEDGLATVMPVLDNDLSSDADNAGPEVMTMSGDHMHQAPLPSMTNAEPLPTPLPAAMSVVEVTPIGQNNQQMTIEPFLTNSTSTNVPPPESTTTNANNTQPMTKTDPMKTKGDTGDLHMTPKAIGDAPSPQEVNPSAYNVRLPIFFTQFTKLYDAITQAKKANMQEEIVDPEFVAAMGPEPAPAPEPPTETLPMTMTYGDDANVKQEIPIMHLTPSAQIYPEEEAMDFSEGYHGKCRHNRVAPLYHPYPYNINVMVHVQIPICPHHMTMPSIPVMMGYLQNMMAMSTPVHKPMSMSTGHGIPQGKV